MDIWKRFGFKATVTDLAGKDHPRLRRLPGFLPSRRARLVVGIGPSHNQLHLLMDNGSADDVEISKIDRVEIQGDHLKMTLRNGQIEEGKFLMPTNQPAEVRFLGITDQYNPASQQVFDFSLPLAKIKEIRFD